MVRCEKFIDKYGLLLLPQIVSKSPYDGYTKDYLTLMGLLVIIKNEIVSVCSFHSNLLIPV